MAALMRANEAPPEAFRRLRLPEREAEETA